MRWTRWIAFAAVVSAACAALAMLSCSSPRTANQSTAAADPAAKIARGRYLVAVTGCGDCHTPGAFYGVPDTTRRLSGSELGWQGPWGVTYARNLTPDQATGIGAWSEADIVKALRTGQRPDASPLLPPMPWPDIALMTDEDIHSVAAYLKTIPAVTHEVPKVVPPGKKVTGAIVVIPPPPAWDVSRSSSPAAP